MAHCIDAGVSISEERGTVASLVSAWEKLTGPRLSTERPFLLQDDSGNRTVVQSPLWPSWSCYLHRPTSCIRHDIGDRLPPPIQNNILKVMRHGYGYETTMANRRRNKSAPKLLFSQGTNQIHPI